MRRPPFLLSFLLAGPAFAQTSPPATTASNSAPSSPLTTTPQSSSPVPLDVIAGSVTITGPNYNITGSLAPGNFVPTGPRVSYLSYSSTITVSASRQSGAATNRTSLTGTNANNTATTLSSSGGTVIGGRPTAAAGYTTVINGTTVTVNGTRPPTTSTSSSARPSNTRPCNGYPELCSRKYSNITNVCAHNSPFTNPRNVARNQEFGAIAQLNDGVRMRKFNSHPH